MASRSSSRRQALQVLFAADAVGGSGSDALVGFTDAAGRGPTEFARELVAGVTEHSIGIDQLLAEYAKEWTVERMPAVDRSILRLACYEIVYGKDVPVAVAIDEAVEAAKELSTDESSRFVNGLLGAMVRGLPESGIPVRAEEGEATSNP